MMNYLSVEETKNNLIKKWKGSSIGIYTQGEKHFTHEPLIHLGHFFSVLWHFLGKMRHMTLKIFLMNNWDHTFL